MAARRLSISSFEALALIPAWRSSCKARSSLLASVRYLRPRSFHASCALTCAHSSAFCLAAFFSACVVFSRVENSCCSAMRSCRSLISCWVRPALPRPLAAPPAVLPKPLPSASYFSIAPMSSRKPPILSATVVALPAPSMMFQTLDAVPPSLLQALSRKPR